MVRQQGMTFIEVLAALFIMVTGILGAVAMQSTAKKGSFDAMQRSLASSLAQDIIERMRTNSADGPILLEYEGVYGVEVPDVPGIRCNTAANVCNNTQMAENDVFEWAQALRGAEATLNGNNAGGLINAVGCISVVNQVVNISISWHGRTEMADGAAGRNTDCGGAEVDRKRRQINFTAFLF